LRGFHVPPRRHRSRWLQAHQGDAGRGSDRWPEGGGATKTTAINGTVATAPVNGMPQTLLEVVEHEALAYRAWNTPEGDFLAEQLERVAQLIAWTTATTPAAFHDRLEVWDRQLADDNRERGYAEGYEAARRELSRHI
jgi:hypothetical protein